MGNEKMIEMLKEALSMEEKGYDFYKDITKKLKNEVTKKTFSFLADQELLHVENIKKFYDANKEKGEFPTLDLAGTDGDRSKVLGIFSKGIRN